MRTPCNMELRKKVNKTEIFRGGWREDVKFLMNCYFFLFLLLITLQMDRLHSALKPEKSAILEVPIFASNVKINIFFKKIFSNRVAIKEPDYGV